MLPVGRVLCWNPPTWFPWKASGGQFQHDIIWPHDPPVHSMARLGPKAMPHLFLRPAPLSPAVPRLYPYSTSAVSHWFHRESLFSNCLPTRCKAMQSCYDFAGYNSINESHKPQVRRRALSPHACDMNRFYHKQSHQHARTGSDCQHKTGIPCLQNPMAQWSHVITCTAQMKLSTILPCIHSIADTVTQWHWRKISRSNDIFCLTFSKKCSHRLLAAHSVFFPKH